MPISPTVVPHHYSQPLLLAADIVQANGWRLFDDRGRLWLLQDTDPALIARLQGCDGLATAHDLARTLPHDLRTPWYRWIDDLIEAGLVHLVGRSPRIGIIGSGALARSIALSLCRFAMETPGSHGARLVLVDVGAPDAGLYPDTPAPTGASALQQWLRPRVGVTPELALGPHWAELAPDEVDFAVVALPTMATDRAVTLQLTRHGISHLVVTQHRHTATVGPAVLLDSDEDERRGGCLCCGDIVRSHADPQWTDALTRLTRVPARVSPSLLGWAATQTAHLVGQGLSPASTGQVWTSSRLTGLTCTPLPAQPDCPCRG